MPRGKATTAKNKAATATAKRSNTSSRTAGGSGGSGATGMSKGGGTGRRTALGTLQQQYDALPLQKQQSFLVKNISAHMGGGGSRGATSGGT